MIKSIEDASEIIYLCQNWQFMRTGILCQLNKKNCAIEKQVTVRLISCEYSFQNINVIPVVKRKDVSFISFIFQKNFWNKWYLIWKPVQGRLESAKKLVFASSWGWPGPLNWKSTTFTRTLLDPFMTEILPVSVLLSNGTL